MSNICRNIKTEYDALKKLNAEFVAACEKAGDLFTISSTDLRVLQILKRRLEEARDYLEKKLENTTWKKALNRALDAVVTKGPVHRGENVSMLVTNEKFQENTRRYVGILMRLGEDSVDDSFSAVIDAAAWDRADRANAQDQELIQAHIIKSESFKKMLSGGMRAMDDERKFVMCLDAIEHFGLLTEEDRAFFYTRIDAENLRDMMFETIQSEALQAIAETDPFTMSNLVWRTIVGMTAAIRLRFLTRKEIVQIQKIIELDAFQQRINPMILHDAVQGQTSADYALLALRALNALKDLDEHLGRRRKKK